MMTVLITGASSGIGAGLASPSLRTATGLSPAAAIRRVCRRYSSTVPTSASALSI